ncbi:S8 family serine peptidase [Aeromicrobium sp. Root472D3]|uniref:S8 family serine peptidase n=1 Tax=Aeromicrobium sp. Root472D3 TaxID=1736540 RepID=UPI0006FF0152|nr:S8 family serine peptidase [Aeromicrobium sp. Root472D3]KQX74837.1 hypothetical protein ASD10_06400 [Aeromicrobium sp. Root472D3]
MRTATSWSTATAVTLLLGLLAAPPTQASEPEPTTTATVAAVGAPDTPTTPRAAGLVVTTTRGSAAVEQLATEVADRAAVVEDVGRGPGGTRVVEFGEPVAGDVAERLATELESRPGMGPVEPDFVRSAADAPPVSVDDPLFPQQKNLWDTGRVGGGFSTRAPAFWQRTKGSPDVRVAVLDTGRTTHPDLTWAAGYDAVSNDADPTDPGDYHGTHVAGIVAARADNGRGVAGVAPGATIVPVRVLDADGSGTDTAIVRGILWAAGSPPAGAPANPSPVQVVTMSLAGPGRCTSTLSNAIATARSRGVVVVAAAGNDARDAAGYAPASCPGVISVGATDDAGARASFSNTGPSVDVSAPGVAVISTYATATGAPAYAAVSGTSMAAPAVAGAAALLSSVGLSGPQIESTLPTMVRPSTSAATAGVLDLGYVAAAAAPARAGTTVSAKVSARTVRAGGRSVVRVRLRSTTSGARPVGRIRVFDGSRIVRTAYVSPRRNGAITVKTPRLRRTGVHRLRVVYLGTGSFEGSRSVVRRVRVR